MKLLRMLGRKRRPAKLPLDRGAGFFESLEQRYQVQLPPDFAEYVRREAPAEDLWDANNFVWWAPQNIKTLTEECGAVAPEKQRNPQIQNEADQYLVFADFMAWCYAYAICCSRGPNRGKVALIGGDPDGFVATSFTEFRALAAEDSLLLHAPAQPRAKPIIDLP